MRTLFAPESQGRFWIILSFLAFTSFIWRQNFLGLNWNTIYFNYDYAHPLYLLHWFHQVVFGSGEDILSPPIFFPLKGIAATSEIPVLWGLVFSILRELGTTPFLAWNVVLGLAVSATSTAMFFACREEKCSIDASFLAAILFVTSTWMGNHFGGGLWYRSAFGLPLTWLFLTRIRDRGPSALPLLGLSVSLLAQFATCMSYSVFCLLLIVIRAFVEPELRRREVLVVLACAIAPVVAAGIGWGIISSPLLASLGIEAAGSGLIDKILFRIDSFHLFFMFGAKDGSGAGNAWPSLVATSFVPDLIAITKYALLAYVLVQSRSTMIKPWKERHNTTRHIVMALAGIAIAEVAAYRIQSALGPDQTIPAWSGHLSAFVWLALVGIHYQATERGMLPAGATSATRPLLPTVAIATLLALGPVIFVWGQPWFVGPTTLLDYVIPGLERFRAVPKMLLIAEVPLCLAVALALDRISRPRRWLLNASSCLVCAVVVLGLASGWLHVGGYPYPQHSEPDAACPKCTANHFRELPLPNMWLQSHHSGGAVLDLPMSEPYDISGDTRILRPRYLLRDPLHLIRGVQDGIPRLNGVTSYFPPDYLEFRETVVRFPSKRVINAIRARGASWVLVHGDLYRDEEWNRLRQQLEKTPDGLKLVQKWGPVWLYRVERPYEHEGQL